MKENKPKKPPKENIKGQKKVTGKQPENIPRGRDAVKKAILEATEKLLLERYPHEISVREIALAAKIKHPLIHRHFGSKDELIAAVHAQNIGKVKLAVEKVEKIEGNIKVFFKAVEQNRFRQVALARAMIDGVDPHLLQDQFPVMKQFLELIKKKHQELGGKPKFDPKIVAAAVSATALGWMLYEPFLLAATGLEGENTEEIKQVIAEILEDFIKQSG
jgi:AcrR family transcriptional regulator